ncbi:MAG: ABC transporter substrate-binding protein [Erysipelotrichaceae bacterium]|nr:ABC transporter substrate-binding protein [Erysipelotrichaceae bacterium]
MNSRKWMAAAASTMMAASAITGCSSGSSSAGGSGTASSGSSKPLIVGTDMELAGNFSPLFASTVYDQWVTNLVYQSMMTYDPDNNLQLTLLTEQPKLSEDGNSVTFKLKEGLKFSDGSDLDANDVKFTFTLMADPEYVGQQNDGTFNYIQGWDEYQKGDAKEVSGIVVENPTTVTFKFATPNIDAVNGIGTFWIMSDTQFPYEKGKMGEYKSNAEATLGSNAYMVKEGSFDKAAGIALVKNDKFPEADQYPVSQVVIKKIATATELSSLESGDINLLPTTIESTIIGPASVKENISFNHYFRAGEGYMGFNCKQGPASDPAVRQALAMATNRKEFVEGFYAFPEASEDVKSIGLGYVPTIFWNPIASTMGSYVTGKEKLDGMVTYDFDIEKAKQTLEDAGWKVGSDGIREKDGQKLTIRFLASEGNSVLEMLIPMISKTWKEIGVDLKQNTVDFNTIVSTVGDFESKDASGWDAYFMAYGFSGLSSTGVNSLLCFSGSPSDPIYMGDNYAHIVDEELNNYLKEGQDTTDEAKSVAAYKKAMVRESELIPYLPIYGNQYFDLYTSNVKNLKTGSVSNWTLNLKGVVVE